MAKYNWQELEKEFLLGDYKNVTCFLKSKKIPNNGNTRASTKGWRDKKRQKEEIIKTKTIEKVIEKESNKTAEKIVNVKNVADELLLKINESITELNKYIAMTNKKTKTVEYDYKVGKPSKEVTEENESASEFFSIIDRKGIMQLAAALKDLNDILKEDENKELNDSGVTIIDDLPKYEKNNKNE